MKRVGVRRPARGAFAEFLFGLFAGVCVSIWLSSSSLLSSADTTVSPAAAPAATTSTSTNAQAVLAADVNSEWMPKPRIPGHKTPTILCLVINTPQNSIDEVDPRVINATWGARCDQLYFETPNAYFPSPAGVGRMANGRGSNTWAVWRPLFAFDYLAASASALPYDYMFVVESKTYAVPDNVRYEFRGEAPGEEALFWGRMDGDNSKEVLSKAFVLSRSTARCLQNALVQGKCTASNESGPRALKSCLEAECHVLPRPDLDHAGKHQIMADPFKLLEKTEVPAHMMKGAACCSVLPLAFMDVGRNVGVRSGKFSYHYYFDYFIRDTAVYGREYMRPLNGIDAGVGKAQIGF